MGERRRKRSPKTFRLLGRLWRLACLRRETDLKPLPSVAVSTAPPRSLTSFVRPARTPPAPAKLSMRTLQSAGRTPLLAAARTARSLPDTDEWLDVAALEPL